MRSGSRSNALLVELLIVVMFFMLSSTVLLELYATSRNQSVRAGALMVALNEAQNVADRLYTSDDAEAALAEMGFEKQGGEWMKNGEICEIRVSASSEATDGGTLLRHEVRAVQGDETYFTLPVAKYQEVQL
ncbi:MAG: hypothetical protein IJI53_02300 [Clostridia bacterium]|nr:hypothetical protein [Clostridia bacterium]MBR0406845.1 hypothetical protein [Clostridia bacterium]